MDAGWDFWFALGAKKLAGSRWFTGYVWGWRPQPPPREQIPAVVESIEQQIIQQAARIRVGWLLVSALAVWAGVTFSTVVRLTIHGIYSAPTMVGAYQVVGLAMVALSWPGLVAFALAPKAIKCDLQLRRELCSLAECLRTDAPSLALALELASDHPRTGIAIRNMTGLVRVA